jgi:hypothetical protein
MHPATLTERARLSPQDPVLPCFSWRDRDFKCFRQAIPLERMEVSETGNNFTGICLARLARTDPCPAADRKFNHEGFTNGRLADDTKIDPRIRPECATATDTAPPQAALLSNGRYGVVLTAAGSGCSTWRGLDVTRWREDATRDCWGQFCYVRDPTEGTAWSAGYQPLGRAADENEVAFHADDTFMRDRGSDYFENTRQANFVQQEYAIRNALGFVGYGEHCWGFTACDGPGWVKRMVGGVDRQFFDDIAPGVPFGPDDGTVAPWVVVASLPFVPEIVIPTVRHLAQLDLGMTRSYGFRPSFNQTFAVEDSPTGWWVTPYHFGIDQGPVALMIENYRTGLVWSLMRRCPYVVVGLRRAGFTGGWL